MVDNNDVLVSLSGKEGQGMSTASIKMDDMIKKSINHEENIIVTPQDILMPHHIADDYENMVFFCPKCDSSLIYTPEEYAKNNLMNSMRPENVGEQPPGDKINEGWMKVVLKCDNCKWADLILKFMKKRERINYGDLINPVHTYTPKRYYSALNPSTATNSIRMQNAGKYSSAYHRAQARRARKLLSNTI